jgi:Helix-turn-helix domain
MQTSVGELGTFLRAHRARVEPTTVGLPTGGDRRVAGLRREEVAVLAVVSADYYTRLEQGRERKPSAQVLNGTRTRSGSMRTRGRICSGSPG